MKRNMHRIVIISYVFMSAFGRHIVNRNLRHGSLLKPGAIIYLVNSDQDFLDSSVEQDCGLKQSLTLLQDKWLKHYPYPVILMNTRKWEVNETNQVLRYYSNLNIKFIDIQAYINPSLELFKNNINNNKKMSASDAQISEFWLSGFLKVPQLQEYRYLMKLDDNICIENDINHDIFDYMRAKSIYYVFYSEYCEQDIVTGLAEYVSDYVAIAGVTVADPRRYSMLTDSGIGQTCFPSFSNNLEVIDTWRYRQADISHFLQNITDSNPIVRNGWSTAQNYHYGAVLFGRPRHATL